MSKSKEVMPFIAAADSLPAHLKESKGLGNEGVSSSDLAVPRLNVLQQLSPQLDEGKAEYLENAKAGLLHNSVTNELFESVYLINLYYKKDFAIFNKRSTGVKQFHGTYQSREEAMNYLSANDIDINTVDIVETGNHYCLLLDENGAPKSPVLISLSATKLKHSNNWNSEIRMLEGDRFASVWEFSTMRQSNTQGSWYNVKIDSVGYASDELYEEAKKAYLGITQSLESREAA